MSEITFVLRGGQDDVQMPDSVIGQFEFNTYCLKLTANSTTLELEEC